MNDNEPLEVVPHKAGALANYENQQPQNMLAAVMSQINNPNMDPARLREFLQIGRELEADQAKREWSAAFRAAKDEIDGIKITKKGQIIYPGKNNQPDSIIKFARYDDLAEVVKPILRKNLLTASYSYVQESNPPKTICVLELLHASGHSREFRSVPLPMVDSGGGKNDVQGAGSVMTYGRRYAIQAAFDIVAIGEDDDGNKGQRTAPKPITDAELETVDNLVSACEEKDPKFRTLFTAWLQREIRVTETRELMQGSQLKSVMQKLKEKKEALGIK